MHNTFSNTSLCSQLSHPIRLNLHLPNNQFYIHHYRQSFHYTNIVEYLQRNTIFLSFSPGIWCMYYMDKFFICILCDEENQRISDYKNTG